LTAVLSPRSFVSLRMTGEWDLVTSGVFFVILNAVKNLSERVAVVLSLTAVLSPRFLALLRPNKRWMSY
jgi:hypothetical protein